MNITIENIELKAYLQELLGSEYTEYLSSPPEPAAIRINRLKTGRAHFLRFLKRLDQPYRVIPFSLDGLILDRDDFPLSHSLAFFTGTFSYQGVSSQLPVILLDVRPGDYVLDMAASPGSKSTQIAGLLEQQGVLVLNDPSRERLQPLNANMQKSGAVNHYTIKFRGERLGTLYPEYFDRVLADVPCTALGNLSQNYELHHWWSQAKLAKLNHIQEHMLISAFKSLKVGAEIVYSTCSIAPEENELMVQKLIDKYPVSIVPPPAALTGLFDPGLTSYRGRRLHPDLVHAIRVSPLKHGMEGFFAIRLRKEDTVKKPYENLFDLSPTSGHMAPEIEPILAMLSQTWGIEPQLWENYRYLLTKTRIWMTSAQLNAVPHRELISAGLLLAEKRLFGWKLVNGSVQHFRKNIKNRCLELEQEDLFRLFHDLKLPFIGEASSYYILTFRGEPVASLYSTGTELRLRSSHRYRLVL